MTFLSAARSLAKSLVAIASLSALPLAGHAAFVTPDSVIASSFFNASYQPENTIDGSGMPIAYDASSSHAAYTAGNHWTTANGALPEDSWIEWQFSPGQSLDAIYLWNHQSTQPHASDGNYDVTLFDLTIYNAANVMMLALNDVGLLPDSSGAQTIGFGGVLTGVSRVRFEIEAIQRGSNSGYTGLAEVGFNAPSASVAAPGPAGALWMLPALLLLTRRLTRKA